MRLQDTRTTYWIRARSHPTLPACLTSLLEVDRAARQVSARRCQPATDGNNFRGRALTSNPTLHTTLTCLGAAVQFLLPAAILLFCTARLVQALRESGRIQRRYWTVVRASAGVVASGSAAGQKGRRLTVILVAIVSDIAIFVLKRDDKLQLTNYW